MLLYLTLFSALSFIIYGLSCIFSTYMVLEFQRYQLARYRVLTGLLQLAGAIGLLLGLVAPVIGVFASGGLAILMAIGFGVRLKIKDSALRASPSFIYMCINICLCYDLLMRSC
jgi:uncharacterized membrane protein YphA (DoxX/SURF4 family)